MSILTHKGDCGDMNTLTNQIGGRRRKIHRTPEYRAQIVEQCAQNGVSVATAARQHDLNVSVVYRWIVSGAPTHIDRPDIQPVFKLCRGCQL
jgi:hypothetical protein